MIETVQPFPRYAIPRVWGWIEDVRSRVCDDFSPKTLDEFLADWESRTTEERWGIVRDGVLGGLITFEKLSPVVGTTHVLFKRSFWGFKTTVPALQMVYSEVFARRGVIKLTALAFRGNNAIRSLAQQIGAKEEGTFRHHTMRGGKPVDMVVLSLLKEDFESCLGQQQLSQEEVSSPVH